LLFQAVAWFLIGVESPHAHTFRIKRGISHSHTFNEDAKVLIVENRDTVETDSRLVGLSAEQQKQIVELTIKLWKKTQRGEILKGNK
jgi:hypothetical protein